MRYRAVTGTVFAVALLLDQLTKYAVHAGFALHDSVDLLGSYLRLTYIHNTGAVFGISLGNRYVMFSLTVAVIALLLYLFVSGKIEIGGLTGHVAVALILGGAFGNLIDRIHLGKVIDFIDMGIGTHRWPVYNMADVWITVGMVLFIVTQVFLIQTESAENNGG